MATFQVTTPNARLGSITAGSRVAVPYSVTNVTGSSQRCEFDIKVLDQSSAAWYTITPGTTAQIAGGATQQVTVSVAPPVNTPGQDYSFCFRAGVSGNTNADFTEGSDVTYTVTPAAKKSVPWAIIAVVAAVLLAIVIGVIYFTASKKVSEWCPATNWNVTVTGIAAPSTMALTCNGSSVSGTYANGNVSGAVATDAVTIDGQFNDTAHHITGRIHFVLDPSAKHFTGYWQVPPYPQQPWQGQRL